MNRKDAQYYLACNSNNYTENDSAAVNFQMKDLYKMSVARSQTLSRVDQSSFPNVSHYLL
jgi:hypothetical protein